MILEHHSKIFLNPQSWAVLNRLPSTEQAVSALDAVNEYLNTDFGLIANYPAPNFFDIEQKAYMPCAAGTKENGGIIAYEEYKQWKMLE